MRVLITGGAGFLGSHLCDRLIGMGHQVVCLDNLVTGSMDNLAHLLGHELFTYVHYNVCDYLYVEGPLDAVMHFASPASPQDYLEFPIATLKVGALGTHKALGLAKAKNARFLLASTSEVYGDPLVSPQSEAYWGNVNPISPRGVYDEAKRFAEAMTMAYHRYHGLDTRIVRIFNSILADETVVVFDEDQLRIEPVGAYATRRKDQTVYAPVTVRVPAFNPLTYKVELKPCKALIGHPSAGKDAYCLTTRYGRRLRVTGDHSVFRRSSSGQAEAVPVRQLKVGDYIAIAAFLPVVERDQQEFNIGAHLIATAAAEEQLWEYALESEAIPDLVRRSKDQIFELLMQNPRFAGSRSRRNTVGCAIRKFCRDCVLPLFVVAALQRQGTFAWPADGMLRPYKGGGGTCVRNIIHLTPDVLWLLGLYLAEGTCTRSSGTYMMLLSSDRKYLERACEVLQSSFGVVPRWMKESSGRAPSLYVHSKLVCDVLESFLGFRGKAKTARVPAWIVQLPLSRLKHFLEGYREGDGTHTNYLAKRELAFNTASEALATDLTYILLRFGLVASLGRYETTFKQRYGERKFPFWRVTVCEVSNFDILSWDNGVTQTLNAKRIGDLVWVPIRCIEPIESTAFVYDFSVPGYENFLAGSGVFAHNTYGPRMRPRDGRVVSNFIVQALSGKPLTIFGTGAQTRSFCYVDDLVEGITRLLLAPSDRSPEQRTDRQSFLYQSDTPGKRSVHEPINIGNPQELTVLEIANKVKAMVGSGIPLEFKPLPADDPKVRCPDISLARALLGWEPKVGLDEGLRRTIEYFRKKLA